MYVAGSLRGTPWEEAGVNYDLFALHTRWDQKEAEKILGKSRRASNLTLYIISNQFNAVFCSCYRHTADNNYLFDKKQEKLFFTIFSTRTK
jgi:hypothetical protein